MIAEETLAPARPNPLAVLWGTLRRPRATFTVLREHGGRAWILAAVLVIVLTLAPTLVQAPLAAELTRETIRDNLQQQAGEGNPVPEEVEQQAMQFAGNPLFSMVFPAVLAVLGLVLTWLIWSGALHLLSTMSGGSSTFGQMIQVVILSWLPYGLRGLLQAVYVLATRQIITNPGLSGLMGSAPDPAELFQAPPGIGELVLRSLLGKVDIFLFWNLALLVIGVIVMARFSRKKALLITLGVWIVLTLIGLLPVLIGSSFSQMAMG